MRLQGNPKLRQPGLTWDEYMDIRELPGNYQLHVRWPAGLMCDEVDNTWKFWMPFWSAREMRERNRK